MEDFSEYNGEGTMLRKVQLRLVDMLLEIDKICQKHDIKYWIDYGTLLGAVRHGGFIPWDDDLDIAMTKENIKRFTEVAPKELPDYLFLQTKSTDPNFRRDIIRVRDNNTLFITAVEDFSRNYHKGLFIDIFEVQSYPNLNKEFQKFYIKWYMKIEYFFVFKQFVTIKNILASLSFPIIRLFLDFLWQIICIGPKDKIGYKRTISPYGNSYSKDSVYPLTSISFEGHTFPAPANPDQYLTSIYGDYMKLPPKEDRRTHIIHVAFFT